MQFNKVFVLASVLVLAGLGYAVFGNNGDDGIPENIAYGNGRIEAVQVDISTMIPGRIQDVFVNEGDLIKAGQNVATIDSAQLRAQHLRAKAEIASAESLVAAAKASIAQVKAQLLLAERELKRASTLVEKGHASRETYDTRVSQRDVAKANLAAAEATLVSRHRGVDATRAVAQEIETKIDDCTLISPVMGRILYRLTEPGEVLGSGGRVLTLLNLSDVYMEIFLPSAQAHRVSIGSQARIKLDILDVAVPARVSFVSPKSQFTPKQVETPSEREKLMFRVKVRVPQELVVKYIDQVKTGIRGTAYIPLGVDPKPQWPSFLQKLPPESAEAASSE